MDEALSLYNNWDKFDRHRKRRLVEMITDCITIGVADDIHIKLYSLMPNSSFFELETNGQRSPWAMLPNCTIDIHTFKPLPSGFPKEIKNLGDAVKSERLLGHLILCN